MCLEIILLAIMSKIKMATGKITNTKLKMVRLWENPNPASEFAPQNVSVDIKPYNSVLVMFKLLNNYNAYYPMLVPANFNSNIKAFNIYDSTQGASRDFILDFDHIGFGTGYYIIFGGNQTANNGRMIPYQIYGVY